MSDIAHAEDAVAVANRIAAELGEQGLIHMWSSSNVQLANELMKLSIPEHVAAVITLLLYQAGSNAVYRQIASHVDTNNIQ